MTEKFVLREAVHDVITDTVYTRQKHPFLSPPATLSPDDTFHTYVQDTLRGPALASMPFFDRPAVVALLDRLRGDGQRRQGGQRSDPDAAREHVCTAGALRAECGRGSSVVVVGAPPRRIPVRT